MSLCKPNIKYFLRSNLRSKDKFKTFIQVNHYSNRNISMGIGKQMVNKSTLILNLIMIVVKLKRLIQVCKRKIVKPKSTMKHTKLTNFNNL